MDTQFVLEDQQAKLARSFIEEYLHSAGYSFHELGILPSEQVKQLMLKASIYASVKLAEIDDRSEIVRSLHHATDPAR